MVQEFIGGGKNRSKAEIANGNSRATVVPGIAVGYLRYAPVPLRYGSPPLRFCPEPNTHPFFGVCFWGQ